MDTKDNYISHVAAFDCLHLLVCFFFSEAESHCAELVRTTHIVAGEKFKVCQAPDKVIDFFFFPEERAEVGAALAVAAGSRARTCARLRSAA